MRQADDNKCPYCGDWFVVASMQEHHISKGCPAAPQGQEEDGGEQ